MEIIDTTFKTSGFLGDSVKIELLFDDVPTSVSIKVYLDRTMPMGEGDFTQISDRCWVYYYQSSELDLEGEYFFKVTATNDDGTFKYQYSTELESPAPLGVL